MRGLGGEVNRPSSKENGSLSGSAGSDATREGWGRELAVTTKGSQWSSWFEAEDWGTGLEAGTTDS